MRPSVTLLAGGVVSVLGPVDGRGGVPGVEPDIVFPDGGYEVETRERLQMKDVQGGSGIKEGERRGDEANGDGLSE
jgi:hypothetical protein